MGSTPIGSTIIMIYIELIKADKPHMECAGKDCKRLPEYMEYVRSNFLWDGETWQIKKGTTCAVIVSSLGTEVYCRDCIDSLYQLCKSKLDSKLWILH